MSSPHPDRGALARFMRGKNTGTESQQIVRHLLNGCVECCDVARSYWPAGNSCQPESSDLPYAWTAEGRYDVTEAFERVLRNMADEESSLAREREEAPMLFDQLAAHPPPRRLLMARNSARFQSWSLCELVLEKSFSSGFSSPPEALELGELGVAIAQGLEGERYSPSLVRDLQARAWGIVGNARRLIGDLRGAQQDFHEADTALQEGTGDALEEAQLLNLRASLASDQRRFDEAIRLADRAVVIYRRAGDHHLMGRSLVSKGLYCNYADDCESAIPILEQALEYIELEREPRVTLAAQHNLVLCLHQCGRVQEAFKQLVKARPLYAKYGDPWSRTGLLWLEGKIALALQRKREAEHAYLEARQSYLDLEKPLDFALVSLDLAALYLDEGRTEEVRQVAAEILPIFTSREIYREALAAVLVFQQAVDRDRVNMQFIHELAGFLDQARDNPRLRFHPGAEL